MQSKITKSLCNLNPATTQFFLLLQQRVWVESSVFRSSKPNFRYRKERDRSGRRGMVGGRGKWGVSKRNPRMGYVQLYQSYPLAISYPWLTWPDLTDSITGKIGFSSRKTDSQYFMSVWLSYFFYFLNCLNRVTTNENRIVTKI